MQKISAEEYAEQPCTDKVGCQIDGFDDSSP
jgi:hypothetical protein